MTEDTRNLIITFLNSLNINPNLNCFMVSHNYSVLNKQIKRKIGVVRFVDGSSKNCIIFKNFPFIIKWSYYDPSVYRKDTSSKVDEALQEVTIYQKAQAAGLDFFFPKTELFYEKNGVTFIMQEKVDCSAREARNREDYEEKIRRITKTVSPAIYKKMQTSFFKVGTIYARRLDTDWGTMAISLYGKKLCKKLCEFVIENKINDLHESNLGYKDYKPIILDFSGYYR